MVLTHACMKATPLEQWPVGGGCALQGGRWVFGPGGALLPSSPTGPVIVGGWWDTQEHLQEWCLPTGLEAVKHLESLGDHAVLFQW